MFLVPPHSVGEVRWGANMMFASILFPQTEISPFEDVQKTLNIFQGTAFTSPVRASQYSHLYQCF